MPPDSALCLKFLATFLLSALGMTACGTFFEVDDHPVANIIVSIFTAMCFDGSLVSLILFIWSL